MSVPAYLLQGESFLIDEALDRVRAEVGGDSFSEATFDATAAGAEVVGALQTGSLLGGRRLVILRDADALKKEQIDALSTYLESPSPNAVLVLIAEGRTKFDAVIRRTGGSVALEAPRGRKLWAWIKQRGRDHALRVDDRGAGALADAVGGELRDLDAALSQLATSLGADARVTPEEVRRAFPRYADERTYVLTDAVGDRKLAVAMTALRRLLQQGDDPLMVFGVLNAHVRRMLRARRAADQSAAAVGQLTGLPGWRAERLQRQARAYNEEELVTALEILAATDVEMKGGDLTPEGALERAVVQVVSGRT